MADAWDPERYERFRPEREQPFHDLLALLQARDVRRAVDLGCGTGRLTAQLHRTLGAQETLGVDSSPAMLQRAATVDAAGLRFERADITEWSPSEPVDVMLSNAVLQWVPDHPRLLARLSGHIARGGELAIQMPANFDHPSHRIAAEVARERDFADALHGYVRHLPVLPPEEYARLLHELGFAEQHVRLQVYPHVLASADAVVEWVRGTLFTDYEVRMPESVYQRFVARYRERLLDALGEQRPYFYAFKRILLWARRP